MLRTNLSHSQVLPILRTVTADTKKFHPGHYVKPQGDHSSTNQVNYWLGVNNTINNTVEDLTEVLGALVAVAPGLVNTSDGVYNWTELDDVIASLVSKGKRIIIELLWKNFRSNPGLTTPGDLTSEALQNGKGNWIWKVWESANMDRLIEIFRQMALRYDTNASVEMICGSESAASMNGAPDQDTYSHNAYKTQLLRLNAANAVNFERTVWAPNLNSLGGGGGQLDELLEDCYQKALGLMSADYGLSRADSIWDGRITSLEVDREFRGTIAHPAILSGNKMTRGTGTDPADIFVEQETGGDGAGHKATHWCWVTAFPSPDSWADILTAIQANPGIPSDMTCPTQYPACDIS